MLLFFKKYLIFFLISGIILLHLTLSRIPDSTWVYFFDIGQGDAALIITPDLQTILIDGGPGETVLEELGATLPFFVREIDLMVLTHPHRDHMEGLIEVLRRYKVNHLLLAGNSYGSSLYGQFLQFARENTTIHFASADQDIQVGDNFLDIIHPFKIIAGEKYENTNNASVVLRLDAPDHKILFTGDCEIECEQEILRTSADLKADILKVGHHGSRTATSQEFLDVVDPQIAIIQSETDNSYEHPHPETLEKLKNKNIQIRRNDLEGRILIY